MKIAVYKIALTIVMLICYNITIVARTVAEGGHAILPQMSKGFDFIENKGQWLAEAKYKVDVPGGVMFLTDRGFVYDYATPSGMNSDDASLLTNSFNEHTIIRHHAYKVNFVNANKAVQYGNSDKRNYRYNYFLGGDTTKWQRNVGIYGRVEQQNVYEGINLALYNRNGKLKYDFIVAAGYDPSKILLEFEGVEPALTKEGSLKIVTTVNEVIEEAPYAYQLIDNKEVVVSCKYRLHRSRLSFELPNGYDKNYPLFIDPSFVFSSYVASDVHSDSWSHPTAYDKEGNLYSALTMESGTWPHTIGSYNTNRNSYGAAIFISKFNSEGTDLIYGTYYGLNPSYPQRHPGFIQPLTMMVDKSGDLVVVGSVFEGRADTIPADLATTPGCYDNTYNGGNRDYFVAKFNSSGSNLQGATYIGGSGGEILDIFAPGVIGGGTFEQRNGPQASYPLEVAIDDLNNIWIGGVTTSNDFPVTANAVQSTFSGQYDGVLFKLNPDCSRLLYSTYWGGSDKDVINDVIVNHKGDVIICGTTLSVLDFPTTTGTVHPSALGDLDAYVSIFNSNTGALLRSTRLGTARWDRGWKVRVDRDDNVYVAGCSTVQFADTNSLANYPVTPGVYSTNGNVFIDKLTPDLSASIRSTRIGSPRDIHFVSQSDVFDGINAFMIDSCGNLYFSIKNNWWFENGTYPSPYRYAPVTQDAFDTSLSLFYVCVLGADFSELRYATRLYGGNWYYGFTYQHHDTRFAKHRFDSNGMLYQSILVLPYPNLPIPPYTTPDAFAHSYLGAPYRADGTNVWTPICYKFDLSEFAVNDTLVSRKNITTCFKDSILLEAKDTSGHSYIWEDGTTFTKKWVYQSGTYYVVYNVGRGCGQYRDTFVVNLHPLPDFSTNGQSCPDAAEGKAQALVKEFNKTVYTYSLYDGKDQLLRRIDSDTGAYIDSLNPGTYKLNIQTATDCDTTLIFRIKALPGVTIKASNDVTVKAGAEVQLQVTGLADRYLWTPDRWLNDNTITNPVSIPEDSITYIVTGSNEYGCKGWDDVHIDVIDTVFIPDAFSPNGDNKNDVFKPVSIGFYKLLSFAIYNRWGDLVFRSTDMEWGWDGTYKSAPADMGTYHYLLQLSSPSGNTRILKGDVTLVR